MRHQLLTTTVLITTLASSTGFANAQSRTVVGQQDWLYLRFEQLHPEDLKKSKHSAELVKTVARLLAENGTQVVMSLTPLKMQLYPGYLPANFQLVQGMETHHKTISDDWNQAGLPTAAQLPVFQAAIAKNPGDLLFFRTDSQWTPQGALLAAQHISQVVKANPALGKIWEAIPATRYTLDNHPPVMKKRADLLPGIPAGTAAPAPESITGFEIQSANSEKLDDERPPAITLFGSSFAEKSSLFPDAMRFSLQRDVLDFAVTGRKGPWLGLIEYLEDTAYRLTPPKLLIWEFAERDLPNGPASLSRETRYQIDTQDWLLQTASLIQTRCTPSATQARFSGGKLPDGDSRIQPTQITAGKTEQDSMIEIRFDRTPHALDYLEMGYAGSDAWQVEWTAVSENGKSSTWTSTVPDEGQPIKLRTAIPSSPGAIQSIQIKPGKGSQISFKYLQVCRHPESLLQGL